MYFSTYLIVFPTTATTMISVLMDWSTGMRLGLISSVFDILMIFIIYIVYSNEIIKLEDFNELFLLNWLSEEVIHSISITIALGFIINKGSTGNNDDG